MNRMGPKTMPCGTPHSRVTGNDSEDPILTFWVWSVKYVAIQVLTVSVMPNQFVSHWSKIPVLTNVTIFCISEMRIPSSFTMFLDMFVYIENKLDNLFLETSKWLKSFRELLIWNTLSPSLKHGLLRSEKNIFLNDIVNQKMALGVFVVIDSEMLYRAMLCTWQMELPTCW